MQSKYLRKSRAYNKLPKQARRKARRALRSPEHTAAAAKLRELRLIRGYENYKALVAAANDDNLAFQEKYGDKEHADDSS